VASGSVLATAVPLRAAGERRGPVDHIAMAAAAIAASNPTTARRALTSPRAVEQPGNERR
jgi:hypothetical protein